MPDPGQLPPSVMQGMGWFPPADPLAAPAGAPLDFGPLPPSIPQGLGWAPPATGPGPDLPPPPAPPQSLPSQAPATGQSASIGRSATPDYQVPESAFGRGQGAPPIAPGQPPPAARPPAPAPARPQTFDQRMGVLDQREAGTEQAYNASIQAGIEATKAQNAEDLAAYQKSDQAIATNAAARKAEQEQWDKIYATNSAQVAADRQQIESWKFNRNAYMDGLGVGDKVRWGIAAILSNVGRALQRQTGPDPVAEMLQQNIHDANEAQFKERDAIVQKLGIDRQSGMDAQQYHATRQAEIDKQDGLVFTMLAQQLKEAAVKTGDQAAQAAGMKAFADVKSAADAKLSSGIQLRSQHDVEMQKVGIAGGELALNRKRFDAEYGPGGTKQQEIDISAAKLMKQGKIDQAKDLRERSVGGMTVDGKPIAEDASNVLLAPSDKEAAKLREQKAGVDTVNEFVNDMSRQIQDAGGASKWLQSPDFQKTMAKKESLLFALHQAYGVQGFRPGVLEQMEKALGGTDPTSFFRSAEPGLKEARDSLNRTFTAQLRVMDPRFKGEYKPADTSTPLTPTPTDEQSALSDALLNPRRGFDKRPGKLAAELGNFSTRGQLGPNETIDTRLEQEKGIIPSIRQTMGTWGAALQSPDLDPEIRRRFYQNLEKIAKDSESPETAAYAQQLIEQAQQQQLSATPGAANAPELVRGSSGAPGSP